LSDRVTSNISILWWMGHGRWNIECPVLHFQVTW